MKRLTLKEMIGEAGSLVGQSALLTNGRTIGDTKNYKSKTEFGRWLQDLVRSEMKKVKKTIA